MAFTVTSDLTVITNGNDGTWTDVGGGAGSSTEPDYFIQGTGCRSRAVSGASASRGMTVDIGAGNELDFSSGGANEDELLYFWIQDYTPNLTDGTAAAPGLTIRIAEGTTNASDYAEWDILYQDRLTPPGTEFFRVYVLDPRCPPTRTSGTWDYNNCRFFGAVLDTNAGAKGQNLGIDRICHGRGELRVTGTPGSGEDAFNTIVEDSWITENDAVAIGSNSLARNGILDVKGQTVFVKGKIVIGDDAGTLATTFEGQDKKFEWIDTLYYDGSKFRSTVGYDDSQKYTGRDSAGVAYYGVDIVGNATNDTTVRMGVAVGTDRGRSGPSFQGSPWTPCEFTLQAAAETCELYGVTFDRFRLIDLSNSVSGDKFFSNTYKRCGPVVAGAGAHDNTVVIESIGAAYTYYEDFYFYESGASGLASQTGTSDFILQSGNSGQLKVVNLTNVFTNYIYLDGVNAGTGTSVYRLDGDVVGSDDHYAEAIIRTSPGTGSSVGRIGLVIALDTAALDGFALDVQAPDDGNSIRLMRLNAGTENVIASDTSFTVEQDTPYLIQLRRNGTLIEAFISGENGGQLETLRLSATDSAHTGTTHRACGMYCSANVNQLTVEWRMFGWGCGPITDAMGAVSLPAVASEDVDNLLVIDSSRALNVDNAGTYSLTGVDLSGSLVDVRNESNGSVTLEYSGTNAGVNAENVGASASTTQTSTAPVSVSIIDGNGDLIPCVLFSAYASSDNAELNNSFTGGCRSTDYDFNASVGVDGVTNETIDMGATIFGTGTTVTKVRYDDGGGTAIGGLTDQETYWTRQFSGNTYRVFATEADAIANSGNIDLTAGSSETHYLRPFPTAPLTFNVSGPYPKDIYWRARKSSNDGPKYVNISGTAVVTADGLNLTIRMREDTIADPTI